MTDLIKVILDEGGPDKKFVRKGYCQINPNMRFPDTTDGMIIGRITAEAFFDCTPELPFVMLLPCDLTGPQRADGTPGWHYVVKYSNDFPGRPQPWNFTLLSTNGPVQNLSALLAMPDVPDSPGGPIEWDASISKGTNRQFEFVIKALNGTPYPMGGTTWAYIVRAQDGSEVVDITTTPTSEGSLTVTATDDLSEVTLTINPAATAALDPGTYQHALWMNPGTVNAFVWASGPLQINSVPQP